MFIKAINMIVICFIFIATNEYYLNKENCFYIGFALQLSLQYIIGSQTLYDYLVRLMVGRFIGLLVISMSVIVMTLL